MRNVYLVSYDVADQKRWRAIYKLMLGAGDPLHYSVFRCELSAKERVLFLEKLLQAMHQKEDRVMLADLGPIGPVADDRVEFYGAEPRTLPDRGALIV